MNATLQRLRAEIRFDREAFEQQLRELDQVDVLLADVAGDPSE